MAITVSYKNSRGQNKAREFNSNQAMQDWLRTVGDQIEVTMIIRSA
jgi:hypothetical protein